MEAVLGRLGAFLGDHRESFAIIGFGAKSEQLGVGFMASPLIPIGWRMYVRLPVSGEALIIDSTNFTCILPIMVQAW